MPHALIRVFLVEDSPVSLAILKRILSASPEIQIVGTACNGEEALELIPQAQPTVICTDLYMPGMNGLEFTKRIMAEYPRPILVISASVRPEDTQTVFQLLQAGAVDVFPKPSAGIAAEFELAKQTLIGKIKILSGVTVFTKHRTGAAAVAPRREVLPSRIEQPAVAGSLGRAVGAKPSIPLGTARTFKAIAIGASTGGPQALQTLLGQLPANFPLPIVCVQHISEGFLQGLINWLDTECRLKVSIAQPGKIPQPGNVYFAPEKTHLEIDSQGRFHCPATPPVDGHRPSVTVTFQSLARFYSRHLLGVLLTGMGRDGAEGMRTIVELGGTTIAQDEKSCVVFGMPKEAIALGAAHHILPITDITPLLLNKVMS